MEIKDRIKELRKAKGLTQFEFADRLKVSRSNIASYETGKNELSSAVISLICRTFSVSETWLRTGKGEMFSDTAREEEIAAFMGDVLAAESEDFRKRFVSMLSSLSVDEWRLIEEKAKELVEKEQEKRRD
ncbi:helix-turn-helix domain-containing protein [Oribacterium sinus]